MAVLTNKSIASTYKSVLSIGATTESALTTSIQQLTDGLGNSSPLSMSTTQIQFNNDANTFSFPADRGTSGQILKLADANGTLSWADDDLSNTLDFSGGTGTGSVTLDTQVLAFTGTANQIETSASSQAITLSFPPAGVTLPDGSEATTQTANDNSLKVATTAFVINEIATSGISGSGADDQIAVFDGSNSVSSSSSFQYDGRILTLQDGVTGDKNIVIGNAGTFPTSNSSTGNVIIGNNAFNDVSQFHTGGENIIIGLNAGQNGTKLSSNILIGKNAGSSLGNVAASTQNSNVFIGQFAGSEITATEGNVIIGGFDGNDGTIIITTDNNNVVLSTGLGAVRAWFNSTGTLRLSAYNASNKTGTVTYLLGTDNSGNVLKTTAGTGTVAGTGTAGTITKWATGGANIEDSIITESANLITVSGAATFSGDVKVSEVNPLIFADSTSNNKASGIITSESGTRKWAMGSNFGAGDGSFNIYNYSAASRYLTISSVGDATFNGVLTAQSLRTSTSNEGYNLISRGGSGGVCLYVQGNTGGSLLDVRYGSTTAGGGTSALKIDGTGAATFGGSVLIGSTSLSGIPLVIEKTTTTGFAIAFFRNNASGGNGLVVDVADNTGTYIADFRVGNSSKMRITSGGDVLFRATAMPSASNLVGSAFKYDSKSRMTLVQASDNNNLTDLQEYFNSNGAVGKIQTNGSATLFTTSSDYRLKENVTPITDALSRVNQLKPSRFNFIADADKIVDGFLAHEVQDIIPEAISGEKDAVSEDGTPDYQGIDQSKIVPLLVAAIQEQQTIIEDLKSRIETLEG